MSARRCDQRAPAGHTCVSLRQGGKRGGLIDRCIRRHLRCQEACGFFPSGFAWCCRVFLSVYPPQSGC
jgi:hypothetical protein